MLHKPHQYPLSLNQIVHSDLEIATPIPSLNSSNPWDRELEKVLHLMTSGNFRSTVNNTVGMHVHVGLSSGTHFPLPAIKKVVAVVILAEPALDRFHPESRRCVRAYNKTLRFQPHLAFLSDAQVFGTIFATSSLAEIQRLISTDTPHRFALVNVGGKKTCEFRQHSGTLEIGAVRMWVGFVLRLVCSAAAMGPDMLRDLLTAGPVAARVILGCFIQEPEVCGYYRYATSLDPPV